MIFCFTTSTFWKKSSNYFRVDSFISTLAPSSVSLSASSNSRFGLKEEDHHQSIFPNANPAFPTHRHFLVHQSQCFVQCLLFLLNTLLFTGKIFEIIYTVWQNAIPQKQPFCLQLLLTKNSEYFRLHLWCYNLFRIQLRKLDHHL